MSIYKVIGNYYVDLLDFLSIQYRKANGDFKAYITDSKTDAAAGARTSMVDKKRELIDKIGFVFQRIDILKNAQMNFYKVKSRNLTMFMIILSLIIVVSAIIIFSIFRFQLKEESQMHMIEKIKMGLLYLITYLIVFTIFFILIINLKENRLQVLKMKEEADMDIERLAKLLNIEGDLRTLLAFVAYKNSENITAYNNIYKQNKGLLDYYLIKPVKESDTDIKLQKFVAITTSYRIDYQKIYNAYKLDILNAITKFYNNGEGYSVVRKELIASSNVLMIKEFRRLIKYYYDVVVRKDNAAEAALIDDNKENVLETYVVADLKIAKNVLISFNSAGYISNVQANPTTAVEMQNRIDENMANANFSLQFTYLIRSYVYAIIYCYQIYLTTAADFDTFDFSLKVEMPQFVDLGLSSNDIQFMTYIQKKFNDHFSTKMKTTIQNMQNATSKDVFYLQTLRELISVFDNYYQSAMMFLQGDFHFPYDPNYMNKYIYEGVTKYCKFKLDQQYVDTIIGIINTDIIPTCYKTYKDTIGNITDPKASLEYRKNSIATKIAETISKFNIKVVENSQYIIGKLKEGDGMEESILAEMMDILYKIDRATAQQKLTIDMTYGKKMAEYRFLELGEFMTKIGDITYNDFKNGLDYVFFKEILDRFYFAVSSSVYTEDRTSKDVYFGKEKNFKLAKIAMIMSYTIISLVVVHFMIGIFIYQSKLRKVTALYEKTYDKVRTAKLTPEERKEVKLQNFEYFDAGINVYIQFFLMIAVTFFVYCLIFSYYKKAKAKFAFNKATIDTNTAELRTSLNDTFSLFEELNAKIPSGSTNVVIKNIPQISVEDKTMMYEKIKVIIDKYEKCNYVLATQKNTIPFPYTEVIVDVFMILTCIIAILYLFSVISPIEKLRNIKELYRLKDKAQYQEADPDFVQEATEMSMCHDQDIDSIIFALKIMFFVFIILFLIFYATKIISSTSEFEFGLYNSVYFDESMCLDF